jgi:GNAT superfamily N-acetyltransferase
MIRPATHDDIPRLIDLGAIMHRTTIYASLVYSPEKTAATLRSLIDGEGVMFVCTVDNVVVGGLAGAITDQWFNDDLVAYELCLFVEPSRRQGLHAFKLVMAFKEWARIKGAKQIQMGITTAVNVSSTTKLYQYAGFHHAGPLLKADL